jgi:hypothetical protein
MLANSAHYLSAIQGIPESMEFHTIFLVSPDGGGTILYTQHEGWKRQE